MPRDNSSWMTLSTPFNDAFHDALQQQHHAAQFIARVGRHLIKQREDDSNTTMRLLSDTPMLVGEAMSQGVRLGLHLPSLDLHILDWELHSQSRISVVGRTRETVFAEMKSRLEAAGVDVDGLVDEETHYEIPPHAVGDGAHFGGPAEASFIETARSFQNAGIILDEITADIAGASVVRIWPHHFDAGTVVPLRRGSDGSVERSLGLGLAIPDAMINEPYYYLSLWAATPVDDFANIEPLEVGRWMHPDWTGGVLPLSTILQESAHDRQYDLVRKFFARGMEILTTRYT